MGSLLNSNAMRSRYAGGKRFGITVQLAHEISPLPTKLVTPAKHELHKLLKLAVSNQFKFQKNHGHQLCSAT